MFRLSAMGGKKNSYRKILFQNKSYIDNNLSYPLPVLHFIQLVAFKREENFALFLDSI